MLRHLIIATLAAFVSLAAHADDRATTKEAEGLVHQAVAHLQKEGKEKAFAAFNDPKGPFTYRDLYIAAYDMSGKCVAHGAKKERIGKNALEEKDADGKFFVKDRIEMAKGAGKGWQEYKFANPVTKKVEQKVAYLERVGDVILVCGAYRP